MGKTALVAGATGLVGRQLTFQLIQNKEYEKVQLLLRRVTDLKELKLEQHIVNFDNLAASQNLFVGVDEVFCCLGTTMKQAGSREAFYKVDFTYVYELARLAKASGVRTFVLNSAMGANMNSSFYYNRVKGEIENKIRELQFEKYIIVRPSLLLGHRQEFRLGEEFGKIMGLVLKPLFSTLLKRYKPVEATDVAFSMMNAAAISPAGITILESDKLHR